MADEPQEPDGGDTAEKPQENAPESAPELEAAVAKIAALSAEIAALTDELGRVKAANWDLLSALERVPRVENEAAERAAEAAAELQNLDDEIRGGIV